MTVEFFEKELSKVQTNFNQTFGCMPTCNPDVRIKAIFAIVQLHLLTKKIRKEKTREDVSKFVITKNRLDRIFEKLTTEKERKKHASNSRINEFRKQKHQEPVRFDHTVRRAY